jgi:hypothetical protein
MSPLVIKVGENIRRDLSRVASTWALPDLLRIVQDQANPHYIDLGHLAKLKGAVTSASANLATITAAVLNHRMVQEDKFSNIDWSSPSPPDDAQQYAGILAYAHHEIWLTLSQNASVGLPIQHGVTGQLVSLMSGKQVSAYGVLLDHPKTIKLTVGDNLKELKVTDKQAVISVNRVLLDGMMVKSHKRTLAQLGPAPFTIVVPLSSLRTRAAEEPLPVSTQLSMSIPQLPENIPLPKSAEEVLASDGLHVIGSTVGKTELDAVDTISADEDSDDEYDTLAEREELGTLALMVQNPEPSNHDPAQVSLSQVLGIQLDYIQAESHQNSLLPTRVFDDIFHVQNRLLKTLSKMHSAFNSFARELSQVMLVEDVNDRRAVEEVLARKGKTWEQMMYSNPDAMHRRVRRLCPPPNILVPQLQALISSWKDVKCSLDPSRGVLFSTTAHKAAEGVLRVAKLGLISDPPGYSLYYKMGVDRDGLPYYRCIRGTNSVEGGIHMPIRRTFGSLRASPELTDALLCNIRHRRNATVGCFNRTGKHFSTHFDDWTRDEIVELAAEAGVSPSFPIPDILATRIVTNETFGIIAIPETLVTRFGMKSMPTSDSQVTPLVKDTPVHLLTRLTTRPISPYVFLAERQQTAHAVIPIHTAEEYTLFTNLMDSGNWYKPSTHMPIVGKTAQTVNFHNLTKRWNEIVHERAAAPVGNLQSHSIFYKLPEQLERHHKLWLEARGRRATLAVTTEQRKPVTTVLADPNRQSHVLPAIITLPPSDLHNTSPLPFSHKGKERAIPSHISNKAVDHKLVTPASGIGVASASTPRTGPSTKKRKTKVCASCKFNNCPNTSTCKGSGNRKLCVCTTHPVTENPRAPK